MPDDVLVVDDSIELTRVLTLLLEHSGFAIRVAHDGLEALMAVEERRPALVLMDMRMPGMDGLQLGRLLTERYGGAIPVVALTAAEHARALADEIGAVDVLSKPVDLDHLIAVVGRFAPRRVDGSGQ